MSAQARELSFRDVGAHIGKLLGRDINDVVLDLVVHLDQSVVHERIFVTLLCPRENHEASASETAIFKCSRRKTMR